MKHISEKQFLEQPIEVQKIFLDWWKNNIEETDLVGYIGETSVYKKKSPWLVKNVDLYCLPIGKETVPLFSEDQLREFIENKIECKIEIVYISKDLIENEESYYRMERAQYLDGDMNNNIWEAKTSSLFEAYWQVACKIASKLLNEM